MIVHLSQSVYQLFLKKKYKTWSFYAKKKTMCGFQFRVGMKLHYPLIINIPNQ